MLVGKSIMRALRLSGRSGSALPGLVVEKANPKFMAEKLSQIPGGVIIVSGTNGKTTTTKTIVGLLEAQGKRVLTNKSGSNFVRGIIGALVKNTRLNGSLPFDIAVFEQDEAHAVKFSQMFQPRGVVALNVMRDQMDRFGEIDTTAKLLQQVVSAATEFVVLNANDQRVSRLEARPTVKKFWFGHDERLRANFPSDDELHDQSPTKMFRAATPDYELVEFGNGQISCRRGKNTFVLKSELSGSHNAINLIAAITTVSAIIPGLNNADLESYVKQLKPAFGRGEQILLKDGRRVVLQLVKNPGGFRHALSSLQHGGFDRVAIAINDDYADGRDVSWLWDVDFTVLQSYNGKLICGGSRAYDMALRLKYDELKTAKIEPKIKEFVAAVLGQNNQKIMIFCTYTAMLRIRKQLANRSHNKIGIEL